MDQLVDFLIKFREKEISVEELIHYTKVSATDIQDLFEDYHNTPECLERFFPKWKYINKLSGREDTSFGAHLKWDENRKELISLSNSHYVDELREMDLFLSESLYGYRPIYGYTHCENTGGDRAAWVSHSDFEVPFYTKRANYVDDLIKQLNTADLEIKYNGVFTVEIENLATATATNLALAVSKALATYFRNPLRPTFWIVQESQEENFLDPSCHSPLLRSLADAERFLEEHKESGYFYRVKELT